MFGIYDNKGLLEGGYFTEGEALEGARKNFPGEKVRVLPMACTRLRDVSRYLYNGLNVTVVVVSPVGDGHWVFDQSFQELRTFPYWDVKAENCGRITEIEKLWEWCECKGIQYAQVRFTSPVTL